MSSYRRICGINFMNFCLRFFYTFLYADTPSCRGMLYIVLICEKSELKSTRANIINFDIKTKHANLYYHAREVHVLELYCQFAFLSDIQSLIHIRIANIFSESLTALMALMLSSGR